MEDNRTPRYDGSDQHSKKAATSSKPTLTSNPRARAGFIGLFGDQTVDTGGLVSKPTFFGQFIRDVDGSDEAYLTGYAVDLKEVA